MRRQSAAHATRACTPVAKPARSRCGCQIGGRSVWQFDEAVAEPRRAMLYFLAR
jgi:hypothetical protein